MSAFRSWLIVAVVAWLTLSAACPAQEPDQTKQEITVRFKVFDTNEPTKALKPAKRAIVYARNPRTLKAFALEEPAISGPDDKGFYEVKVQKGWLIEQLEISVVDGDKIYNPGSLTKVISAADMIAYPGASKSTDRFSFQSYLIQMGAYRALLAQLIEEVEPQEQDRRRTLLRGEFEPQLRRMANLDKRIPDATPEEREAARKLADEVLELYGMREKEYPAPTVFTYPACPVYPMYPCYPPVWQPAPVFYPMRWCR